MDLAAVMDDIGDRLDTIDGLRVYRYPADNIAPPAAVVTYPESYSYDETYGRGTDRITLPVVIMVGKVSDRASRDRIAQWTNGSGPNSLKQILEVFPEAYTAFDTMRVTGAEFDIVSMGQVDYLTATFSLDISGTGA